MKARKIDRNRRGGLGATCYLARLGAWLYLDARRPWRRLWPRRPADDRKRDCATSECQHGQSGEDPRPLAAALRLSHLLERLWQAGDDVLGGCQLLGKSLLGGLQIVS